MAILKAVAPSSATTKKKNLPGIIAYVLDPKKTERMEICEGINCTVPTCLDDMRQTKKDYGKTTGREYYHFIRSYAPHEVNSKTGKEVTPKDVLKETIEFIQKCKIKGKDKKGKEFEWNPFEGYEVLVAVHKDKDHLHAHIIVNSVSFLNGHKFQYTKGDLARMKMVQNQMAIEKGWSPAPAKGMTAKGLKREDVTTSKQDLYQVMKKVDEHKADSWVFDCATSISKNMKKAKTKEEFINLLFKDGFETEWKEGKKHVVFTCIAERNKGKVKCKKRLAALQELFRSDIFTKEAIENEIQRNAARTESSELGAGKSRTSAEDFGTSIAARQSERIEQSIEQRKSGHSGEDSEQDKNIIQQSTGKRNSEPSDLDKQFSDFQQRKRADELRHEQVRQLEAKRREAEQRERERIQCELDRISKQNKKSGHRISKSDEKHHHGR